MYLSTIGKISTKSTIYTFFTWAFLLDTNYFNISEMMSANKNT